LSSTLRVQSWISKTDSLMIHSLQMETMHDESDAKPGLTERNRVLPAGKRQKREPEQ
jgi:hypothetical protein